MDYNKQLELIQEAYTQAINEKVESKFKTGDKVGIGNTITHDPLYYRPIDTGTITKTSNGVHHVTFDNKKEASGYFPSENDTAKPLVHKFGGNGKSLTDHVVRIIPMEEHSKRQAIFDENDERKKDLNSIGEQLSNMRNGYGNYPKLAKHHVDAIKAILDKHSEE